MKITNSGRSGVLVSISMHACTFRPFVKILNNLMHIWAGVYGTGKQSGGGLRP